MTTEQAIQAFRIAIVITVAVWVLVQTAAILY